MLLVVVKFSLDAFVGESLDVQGEGNDDVATQTDDDADEGRPARRLGRRRRLLSWTVHDKGDADGVTSLGGSYGGVREPQIRRIGKSGPID